jgi:hypothetical protein
MNRIRSVPSLAYYRRTADPERKKKFSLIADWLVSHLEPNANGLSVWNHHFKWKYRDTLKAPWHSGLAQGQGISVLMRAHTESGDVRYLHAARIAFESFQSPIEEGGMALTDESGDLWFEEYIVSPPTHILNGLSGRSGESMTTRWRPRKALPRNYSRAVSVPFCTISIATISDSGRSTSNLVRACPWWRAPFIIACTSCSCA